MKIAGKAIRNQIMATTAVVAMAASFPNAAEAQIVRSTDLSSAVDSAGNPNRLTVTDTSAIQTDIELEAGVVIAEWADFNIDFGDIVNVTIDAGLGLSEATLFNRVIGGNPSNINGTLNAAGINFWLVNQNGIMFGADATVNARSFLASTNDVANQDIFDFYEGTDLFGNGSNRLGFVDPTAGTAQAITAANGATFVTDGSLGFVGQALNLNASFDAGSGRAFFIAASDIDVTFTPNSPLAFSIGAGTTVASQVIDGSVTAGSVEFALFNSAGVVGALLQVDASVNATNVATDGNRVSLVALGVGFGAAQPDVLVNGAIASDGDISILSGGAITTASLDADEGGGVSLNASGNITTTSITSNEPGVTNGFIVVRSTNGGALDLGTLTSDGDIDTNTTGSLTTAAITTLGDFRIGAVADPSSVNFTGNVSADAIDIDSTGTVNALALDATDGDLNIDAGSISAGAVSATEGDVILSASGNITTTSITSDEGLVMTGGAIDIDSTGGGTLDLGAITGDGAANFDTTGTLTLGTVNVGGAMEIGGAADPTTLNLNGDITAGSFTSSSANAFSTANDITATDGNLSITASSISTGNLEADNGGGVILSSPGDITTTSITSNEPGATNGFIDIGSTSGGALDLGTLTSDGNIDIDTTGSVTTAAITTLGDLTIGGVLDPSSVNITGNVDADAIDIDSTGAVNALGLEATDGDVNVSASAITAGAVSSTEGDVILQAVGNITTASITSNEFVGSGGAIDVDSTGGGTLDLGTITGDGAANFDTTGTLTLGTVNVGGAMEIGGTADPTTLNLNGDITAGSFTSASTIAFSTGNDITATDGNLSITASSISTGDLEADGGGGVILTATGNIMTASITSNEPGATNGFIDVQSTGGGTLDLGALTSDGNIDLDTSGALTTASILSLGDLTIGAGAIPASVTFTGNVSADMIDIDATGAVMGLAIDATDGNLDINAGSIGAGAVSATEGDVILSATNNITTTSITSNEFVGSGGAIDVDSTGGGILDLGTVSGDGAANFDTSGTLTLGLVNIGGALVIGAANQPTTLNLNDDITAGSFTFTSANPFVSQDITTTNGDLNIDAASITTGNLEADNGGGVILTATGNIMTASITSNEPGATNGFINVDSTGGGMLDLGALTSDGNIDLDTSGLVTTAAITTLGDLTIGGTTTPMTVSFTGNVSADVVTITAIGDVTGMDIESTDGDLNIVADTIDVGGVTSTEGDVILSAMNNITTTSITSNEFVGSGGAIDVDSTGGSVDLGAITSDGLVDVDANMAVVTGAVSTDGDINLMAGTTITTGALDADGGGGVILTATGNITTASITSNEPGATNGFIDVQSTGGGTLDLGALTSDGNIDLDTSGALTTASILSLGDLTIGAGAIPASVTFTGNVSADMIDIDATGAVMGLAIDATDGNLDINAGSISAGAVSATEGDVILQATNNITTTSITSNEFVGSGGAIDVDSTGGSVDLGTIMSDGLTDVDAGMAVMTGDVTTVAGDINLAAGTTADIGSITTTINGAANISAQSIIAGNITALGGTTANATAGDLVLADVTGNGPIDLDATGTITFGTLTSGGLINVNGAGGVTGGSALKTGTDSLGNESFVFDSLGDVSLTGTIDSHDAIVINAGGTVTANLLQAFDNVNITSTGLADIGNIVTTNTGNATVIAGSITVGGASLDGDFTANATAGDFESSGAITVVGAIDFDATGDVDFGSLTAGNSAFNVDAGGDINFASSTSTNTINMTAVGAINGGDLTATNALNLNGDNISIGDAMASSINFTSALDILFNSITSPNTVSLTALGGTIGKTASGNGDIDSGGSITLNSAAADLGTLDANNAIAVTTSGTAAVGSSTSGASTNINGLSVTLGVAGMSATHQSNGDVSITASNGDIEFLGNLTLQSDADASGAGDLSLTSRTTGLGNGNIGPAAGSTVSLLGGTAGAARPITVELDGDFAATNVDGQSLSITDGTNVTAPGSIAIDTLAVDQSLALRTADGSITINDGMVRNLGASLTLAAGGATSDVISGTAIASNGGDILVSAERNVTTGGIATALSGTPTAGTVGIHAGGMVNAGSVNAGEDLLIEAGGAVTFAGGSAGDDVMVNAGGDISLTGDLAATGTGIDVLRVGFVGAAGTSSLAFAAETSALSNVTLDSTGGAITINGAVSSANNVNVTSVGDAAFGSDGTINGNEVVVSTDAAFINNRGSDAITASDHWIVYSDNPNDNVFSGLDSGNTAIWNSTLASTPPATISDNRYVFAFQPTLVIGSGINTKTYGDDITAALSANFIIQSGLQTGILGAFLGDTQASVLSGLPVITSLGSAADANVTGSPYGINIALGTLMASHGYAIILNNAGQLTVVPRELLGVVTADDKTYDGTTDGTGSVTLNGVLTGDDVGSTGTVFTFANANAGAGITVNVSGTSLTGTDAGNYSLTIPATVLADIFQRAITANVTAEDKTYDGTTDGTGSVTLNGVLAGDDVGSTGTVFTFANANAGAGITVNVSGTSLTGTDAGNYSLTIPATVLADIFQRVLRVEIEDAFKFEGTVDPEFIFSIIGEGLIDGDTLFGMLAREAGEDPSERVIIRGTLDAGPNYILQISGGVLTIAPAPDVRQNTLSNIGQLEKVDQVNVNYDISALCVKLEDACELD
ncbi:MAG: hypothetical protein Pars2KO_04070 [Parasphingorhabdus sp.]